MAFRNGDRIVVFAIQQALRSDAAETVRGLKALGLDVEILSGDRPSPVAEAARSLGVETFHAGMTPADKIHHLKALAAKGHKVLMVGDGLNDAPALAAAHVSLSPVTAVHLTQAAADAVFLGSKLAPVLAAVGLSRRARGLMIQNLWLAVVYNAIAVPLAIAGYATPLVAALAMSGSSVIVTLNALRAQGKAGGTL
jgi:Cu2+-exporting ATPase